MISYGNIPSTPIGPFWIARSLEGIVALEYHGGEVELLNSLPPFYDGDRQRNQDSIDDIAHKISTYFQGKDLDLNIDVDWRRFKPFQNEVLQVVYEIPAGKTKSYGQIAEEIGRNPAAARAVGRAVATNPIPIIIPCHRVVGANGDLTGYGGPGGVATKAWLLSLEGNSIGRQLQIPI